MNMALISIWLLVVLCTYTFAKSVSGTPLDDKSTDTSTPLLSLAITGPRIHAKVPDLSGNESLVQELLFRRLTAAEIAGTPLGLVNTLKARIRFSNPFNKALTIHSIDVKVYYGAKINDDLQVGFIHDQTPAHINPYQELITPYYVNVTIAAKINTLTTMIANFLQGSARLSFYGFISFILRDGLFLNQLNVTITTLNTTAQEEPKA